MTPRYFQFNLSPMKNHSSTVISIRVDDEQNTITCYHTYTEPGLLNKIPLVGQFFPGHKKTSSYFINECLKNYITESTNAGTGVHENRIGLDFAGHDRLHADSSEKNIFAYYRHTHLEYDQPIGVKTLRKFLKSLKECEKTKAFPENEELLTDKACKEIVDAYKEFRADPSSTFVTSNNPHYGFPMPSVAEHYAGIMAGNPTSYLADSTPAGLPSSSVYLPVSTTPSFNSKDAAFVFGVGTLILMGARKLGLFGRAHHNVKPNESRQEHIKKPKQGRRSHTH